MAGTNVTSDIPFENELRAFLRGLIARIVSSRSVGMQVPEKYVRILDDIFVPRERDQKQLEEKFWNRFFEKYQENGSGKNRSQLEVWLVEIVDDGYDRGDALVVFDEKALIEALGMAIETLDPRSQLVLLSYYGLGGQPRRSMNKLAASLARSSTTIEGVRRKAIVNLRRIPCMGLISPPHIATIYDLRGDLKKLAHENQYLIAQQAAGNRLHPPTWDEQIEEQLDLSHNTVRLLLIAGIYYIGQLIEKSEAQLLKTKNFGRKKLKEIKDCLEQVGLSLGTDVGDWQPPASVEEASKSAAEEDRPSSWDRLAARRRAVFDLPLNDLDPRIEIRTANILQDHGIRYVGQLIQLGEEGVGKLKLISGERLKFIKEALSRAGLTLEMDASGWEIPSK